MGYNINPPQDSSSNSSPFKDISELDEDTKTALKRVQKILSTAIPEFYPNLPATLKGLQHSADMAQRIGQIIMHIGKNALDLFTCSLILHSASIGMLRSLGFTEEQVDELTDLVHDLTCE